MNPTWQAPARGAVGVTEACGSADPGKQAQRSTVRRRLLGQEEFKRWGGGGGFCSVGRKLLVPG